MKNFDFKTVQIGEHRCETLSYLGIITAVWLLDENDPSGAWFRLEFIWHRPLINGSEEVHRRTMDLFTNHVDNAVFFVDKNFTVKLYTKKDRLSTRDVNISYLDEIGFIRSVD